MLSNCNALKETVASISVIYSSPDLWQQTLYIYIIVQQHSTTAEGQNVKMFYSFHFQGGKERLMKKLCVLDFSRIDKWNTAMHLNMYDLFKNLGGDS